MVTMVNLLWQLLRVGFVGPFLQQRHVRFGFGRLHFLSDAVMFEHERKKQIDGRRFWRPQLLSG